MGFFADVAKNVGNFFGANDDDKKKKQQLQKAQPNIPVVSAQQPQINSAPKATNQEIGGVQSAPTNGITLTLPSQPASKQLQKSSGQDNIAAFKSAVIDPIAGDLKKAYNTVQAPVTGLVGLASEAGDRVFNGGKNANVIRQATNTEVNKNIAQSFVPQKVASGKASVGEFGTSFADTGVKLAPYAVGGGGGVVEKLGSTVAGKVADAGANVVLQKAAGVGAKAGANVAISTPLFGSINAAQQALDPNRKSFDINEANQAGLEGGLSTAAGEVVGAPLRKVFSRGAPSEVAPGVHSANPTREVDAATQVAQKVDQQRVEAEQAQANDPEFIKQQAAQAEAQKAKDAADLAQQDVSDVPSIIRRGNPNPTNKTKEARVEELNTVIKGAPDPAQLKTVEFSLKQQFAENLRARPDLEKPLREQLKQRMTQLKADSESVGSAIKERDFIQGQLDKEKAAQESATPSTEPASAAATTTPEPVPAPAPSVPDSASTPAEPAAAPPQVKTGEATWKNGDTDQPVNVTGYAGKGNDGRDYVNIEGTSTAIPLDEVSPQSVTPDANPLPTGPDLPGGKTRPVAPRTHDAIVKQLGDVPGVKKGKYTERDVLNLEDNTRRAEGVIANMSDDDVITAFQTKGSEDLITGPADYAVARAALDRLGKLSDDPRAAQTVSNILEAMDQASSKSGQLLRVVQEDFDKLPIPMKIRYIVKKIDNANKDVQGYQKLSEDPAKQKIVETEISKHLEAGQTISERIAATEGKLEQAANDPAAAIKDGVDVESLAKDVRDDRVKLQESNGELAKYYTSLVPGRTKAQTILNDFPRRMMLASFTGRLNDIATTSNNVANLTAENLTQSVIAKAVNAVSPGKVTVGVNGTSRLASGAVQGLKKFAGQVRGKEYVDDVAQSLRNKADGRTGLQKSTGRVSRTIQAATEVATELSRGVADQRVVQLAAQEAAQKGYTGAERATYIEARSAVPSRQMREAADQLHKEMNNLNDNPLSNVLNRIGNSFDTKNGVGGLIKNQVIPFTSWLGGNIWNSITDKNVVASSINLVRDAARGDAEGAVRNLAKTINGGAEACALGYLLTKSGVLTNQDAEGYSDSGAYFHIGDRYIPVGFFGFAAPNIILGNAAYQAINPAEGKTSVQALEEGAMNLLNSVGFSSALGINNNIQKSYQAAKRPGGSFGDGVATFAAGVAGQYIPAATGDVNGILNQTDLNPTHEQADTKAINSNSKSGKATDVKATALNNLVNRVPVVSQLALPRKAGVAADDTLDRITRGDRETGTQVKAKADEKAAAATSADLKKRNVPDPTAKGFDDAVEARIENGKYDEAIEGMKAKIAQNEKDPDIPKSKSDPLRQKIAKTEVWRDGKFTKADDDLYKKTSVSEWRNMGDPDSDDYDPDTYQKLYNYDNALKGKGISGSSKDGSDNKFTVKEKKAKSGGRGSAASAEASRIRSNMLGSAVSLGKVDLGDLSPKKATATTKIPTIQQIKPGELIKKRQISVSKA